MVSEFTTKPKRWGNSLGITIPREIVEREGLDTRKEVHVMLLPENNDDLLKLVGKFTFDKSTDEIMREMDEGW